MPKKRALPRSIATELGLSLALQDIVDSIEDELLVIDTKYKIKFANSALRTRLKSAKGKLVGGQLCYRALYDRDEPCGGSLWQCPLVEIQRRGYTSTTIHPTIVLGVNKYFKISAYPLRDSDGNIEGIVELRRDVTAERDLEIQILKRHHQLLALNRISGAMTGMRDLDSVLRIALDNVLELIDGAIGGILLLNEKTKALNYRVQYGLSAKYTENRQILLGEGIAGRVALTSEPILVEDISQDPRAARPDLVSAEGLKGFVSIPLKARDKVVGVMNVASHIAGRFGADDVSLLGSIGDYLGATIEQARLYERLTRVGERYRALLQHALTAQEQERKRIARELHDETSQAITSMSLSLQAIIGMAEIKGIDDAEFMDRLKKAHSYAVHAGNEIVKLMKEMRPTLLDELGMPAAIHRYAKDALQSRGINVSTEFKGTDERFPPEVEVTLFRVAQGAIGNILEHSEAKNASIKIDCSAKECVLQITDDGKGFDVNRITRVDPSGRGAGVFTMKERVRLVGGNCNIKSKPGQGAKVTVRVPLAENVTGEED